VDFSDTLWGFDGTVAPGRCSPFSVVVSNPTDASIDGTVVLQEGVNLPIGVPWTQHCFLAPHSARRLQFYPWIDTTRSEFSVSWANSSDRIEVDAPKLRPLAVVRFDDGAHLFTPIPGVANFDESLFPDTVAATGGLSVILLDHAPRLQPLQRRALRDWLAAGGTLVLGVGPDGHPPHFTDDLAIFNSAEHALPDIAGRVAATSAVRPTREALCTAAGLPSESATAEVRYNAFSDHLFQHLAEIVKPKQDWSLIYLLLALYLAAIGPGMYIAARLRLDYRLVTAAYLGVVAVGSGAMWFMGQRGYGERAQINTIALAQSLGNGDYIATQWSNLFVTASGHYEVSHSGDSNQFSCPSSDGIEDGVVAMGNGGVLAATVPLFSSRPFIHIGHIAAAGPEPTITAYNADEHTPASLVIDVSGSLPSGSSWAHRILDAQVVVHGALYPLKEAVNRLTLAPAASSSLANAQSPFMTSMTNYARYGAPPLMTGEAGDDHQVVMRWAFIPLMGYSLGFANRQREEAWQPIVHDDRLTLFLLVDQPPTFHVTASVEQHGSVVYRFDLPCPARSSL
jgi:hypothetical protein